MHIPDNYLSPATCAAMGTVMLPIWVTVSKKVKERIDIKKMPLMGVGASLSFLTMMFNVPVPGGTTAHAVGGTLLAIWLGPEAATLCISITLLVQALLFGDGGILAYGANCFNMAFVIPFVGYGIYSFFKDKLKNEKIAAALGSYVGINAAALCASIELGIQPLLFKDKFGMPLYCPYPLKITIPSMLIPHLAVVGILEVIITIGVLGFVKRVSKGTIYEGKKAKFKAIYALIAILIILTPIGLIASGSAWGEWSPSEIKTVVSGGKTLGYVPSGMLKGIKYNAFMNGYSIKGISDIVGYILSAVLGVSLIIIIFRLISSTKKGENNAKG
ncbi:MULTISPECIES: cobalt transporter CbiM [Clostridium]|uniref:cobalt transporter CbiM n=1 Tax=Clostridium TaxID=1485 RepID=UPI000825B811|nr:MULTISPECIES: cobalt transporter CbiM [Clostridium]PJI08830.1 cobalamin biosynthesis protein CbiM [Clostridium sp. CT7]